MNMARFSTVVITHGQCAVLENLLISPTSRLTDCERDTIKDLVHQYKDAEVLLHEGETNA